MKPAFFSILILALGFQTIFAQERITEDDLKSALETIVKVDVHGAGHADAVNAMVVLNSISPDQVPMLFEAFDDSNPISANWIRAAVQKALYRQDSFPGEGIEAYFRDQSKNPKGRWLAWNLICDQNPEFRTSTIDALATDSSMPLREIGIAKCISDAESLSAETEEMTEQQKDEKKAILTTALENARDVAQIKAIAKSLEPLGEKVNLREHLGFMSTWGLVSGFDNKDQKGFNVVYDPEVDARKLEWEETETSHETGVVDLNDLLGKKKGEIAYASTVFKSSADCEAEVRIGTPNAHKIWINGTLVMSNEVYHNSNSIDKFSAPVKLKAGENQVLVKICQNEQKEPWAQDWSFQVRFCDSTGKPVR